MPTTGAAASPPLLETASVTVPIVSSFCKPSLVNRAHAGAEGDGLPVGLRFRYGRDRQGRRVDRSRRVVGDVVVARDERAAGGEGGSDGVSADDRGRGGTAVVGDGEGDRADRLLILQADAGEQGAARRRRRGSARRSSIPPWP